MSKVLYYVHQPKGEGKYIALDVVPFGSRIWVSFLSVIYLVNR